MERVARTEPLVEKGPTLTERIKQRQNEARKKKGQQWQDFLQKVGKTPLAPGSKELEEAVAWTEEQAVKACVDCSSFTVSFSEQDNVHFPFFPTLEELGPRSDLTRRFRKESAENLRLALFEKDVCLKTCLKFDKVEIMF